MLRLSLPLLALAGCTAPAPSAPLPPSLMFPATITARDVAPASRVHLTVGGGLSPKPAEVDLRLTDLRMELDTGAAPRLVALELPLHDVDIPASALPPSGLKLRDLRLFAAPGPARVMDAQPDALEAQLSSPLTLTWSMLLDDGTRYPLGAVHTRAVTLDVHVARAAGSTFTTVTAKCSGSCWSIDGVVDLRDGDLYAEGAADVTATP